MNLDRQEQANKTFLEGTGLCFKFYFVSTFVNKYKNRKNNVQSENTIIRFFQGRGRERRHRLIAIQIYEKQLL